MAKSSTSAPTTKATKPEKIKPEKPRADFPLFPHACGRWAKVIRGKTHYFAKWDQWQKAEEEYLAQADDLHAGRAVRAPKAEGGPSVRDVVNAYLRAKRIKLDAGNLSPRSFADMNASCKFLVEVFGSSRAVLDLKPDDFEKLYEKLSERKRGDSDKPVTLVTMKGEVGAVRSIFKYAFDADLIDRPIKFGPIFKAPSTTELRKEEGKRETKHGSRTFTAKELRLILKNTSGQFHAMVLLGVNVAYGNNDLASLPLSALDLKGGWVEFARPKTGAPRRAKLWPETIEALREVIANRREPADLADAGLVFITRLGQRWTRFSLEESTEYGKKVIHTKQDDAVAKAMGKVLRTLGLKRPGLSFYSLRHSFATQAAESMDQLACDLVMGHLIPSVGAKIGGRYRHGVSDARLEAVASTVHNWLFADAE